MLANELMFSEELDCTVLEVKDIKGYGTTVDVILAQGRLREVNSFPLIPSISLIKGDTIIMSGLDGAIVTTVRSLLMPAPMKELRVKNAYVVYKEVKAAAFGVKISAKNLDKAVRCYDIICATNV